jgi:hypothetical protein
MLIIPVKAEQHKEEVEEAGYLASASDLMVGLLFVFIIVFIICVVIWFNLKISRCCNGF